MITITKTFATRAAARRAFTTIAQPRMTVTQDKNAAYSNVGTLTLSGETLTAHCSVCSVGDAVIEWLMGAKATQSIKNGWSAEGRKISLNGNVYNDVQEILNSIPAGTDIVNDPSDDTGYCIQNFLEAVNLNPEFTGEFYTYSSTQWDAAKASAETE